MPVNASYDAEIQDHTYYIIAAMTITCSIAAIICEKLPNRYVLQLAIADILFLQSVPLKITEMLRQDWILGVYPCKVFESLKYINYYASILFITVSLILAIVPNVSLHESTYLRFDNIMAILTIDVLIRLAI